MKKTNYTVKNNQVIVDKNKYNGTAVKAHITRQLDSDPKAKVTVCGMTLSPTAARRLYKELS